MPELQYKNNLGDTCNYKVISNICKYYGVEFQEEFVYLFFKATYKNDNMIHINSVSVNSFQLLQIQLHTDDFITVSELKCLIHNLIINNNIILINTNPQYLPFYVKNNVININNSHCCIIYGIDGDDVLLADNYVPTYPPSTYNGKLSVEEVYHAINHSRDPGKVFTFSFENVMEISIKDLYEKYYDPLIETLINDNKVRKNNEEQNNVYFQSVMQSECFNSIGYKMIKKFVERTRTEWMGLDGPVVSRGYLTNIYQDLLNVSNDEKFKVYKDKMIEFKSKWDALSRKYIKFAITKDCLLFQKCSGEYIKLLTDEIEFFEKSKIGR